MTVMWWYGGGSPGWGQWLVTALTMLALWALLAGAAVALWRAFRPPPADRAGGRDEARQLLDERFARGEIDEAEYTRRRDVLAGRR